MAGLTRRCLQQRSSNSSSTADSILSTSDGSSCGKHVVAYANHAANVHHTAASTAYCMPKRQLSHETLVQPLEQLIIPEAYWHSGVTSQTTDLPSHLQCEQVNQTRRATTVLPCAAAGSEQRPVAVDRQIAFGLWLCMMHPAVSRLHSGQRGAVERNVLQVSVQTKKSNDASNNAVSHLHSGQRATSAGRPTPAGCGLGAGGGGGGGSAAALESLSSAELYHHSRICTRV